MDPFEVTYQLVLHHPLAALGGWYVYSAAVSSLPLPDQHSSKFYRWFFAFSHTLAGFLKRAAEGMKSGKVQP